MEHAEAAKRHRHQAEECRAKADLMSDETTRSSYLNMADAYDAMAANEEQMAGNFVLRPPPEGGGVRSSSATRVLSPTMVDAVGG